MASIFRLLATEFAGGFSAFFRPFKLVYRLGLFGEHGLSRSSGGADVESSAESVGSARIPKRDVAQAANRTSEAGSETVHQYFYGESDFESWVSSKYQEQFRFIDTDLGYQWPRGAVPGSELEELVDQYKKFTSSQDPAAIQKLCSSEFSPLITWFHDEQPLSFLERIVIFALVGHVGQERFSAEELSKIIGLRPAQIEAIAQHALTKLTARDPGILIVEEDSSITTNYDELLKRLAGRTQS